MFGRTGNNPANDPDKKPIKGHSMFKPNMSLYQTLLFGLNTPSFAMEVVPDDQDVSIRCTSDLDTMSLSAPVMSPMKMVKDYAFVPLKGILPRNHDLLVTNPLTGEDIDPSEVSPLIDPADLKSYATFLVNRWNSAFTDFAQPDASAHRTSSAVAAKIGALLSIYQGARLFFSEASLANYLGISMHRFLRGNFSSSAGSRYLSCDEVLERGFSWLRSNFKSFEVLTAEPRAALSLVSANPVYHRYFVDLSINNFASDSRANRVSLHQLFEILRDECFLGVRVDQVNFVDGVTLQNYPPFIYDDESNDLFVSLTVDIPDGARVRNISRLVAYQLMNTQFYTNDSVDYVYTPQLYHSNLESLVTISENGNQLPSVFMYSVNGVQQLYDTVSATIISAMLDNLQAAMVGKIFDIDYDGEPDEDGGFPVTFSPVTLTVNGSSFVIMYTTTYARTLNQSIAAHAYFANIFGFQRSLRYRDYFVGSKKYPLAVGNVDVSVNDSKVNVVDVTRNIQVQRYLNQVNRIGRTLKEYIQGIFNTTPPRDPRECIFLASTVDNIGAEETSNTGSDQLSLAQSKTSNFRLNSSRYAFSFDSSEYGIIIGITYFDVPRPYTNVTDRPCFHIDRFDMFNPYMQRIGDQAVYGEEINSQQVSNFGYQLRYSEYKQRVDRAVGGFLHFLPGYAFLADDAANTSPGESSMNIRPDFIRSRPYELDKFFVALTNDSPAGYFHFILRNDYDVSALRPMEAAPSIL